MPTQPRTHPPRRPASLVVRSASPYPVRSRAQFPTARPASLSKNPSCPVRGGDSPTIPPPFRRCKIIGVIQCMEGGETAFRRAMPFLAPCGGASCLNAVEFLAAPTVPGEPLRHRRPGSSRFHSTAARIPRLHFLRHVGQLAQCRAFLGKLIGHLVITEPTRTAHACT